MNETNTDYKFNLKNFLRIVRQNYIQLVIVLVFFLTTGVLYSISLKDEFKSEGKILPEISVNLNSPIGGLANLVGIGGFELGLKNSTEAIRPDLYPDILKSAPFFIEILNKEFRISKSKKIILSNFLDKYVFKENTTSTITTMESTKEILTIDKITEKKILELKNRITVRIDNKSGIITISVVMPDPVLSAEIANFSMNYLTDYVIDYRTQKLKLEYNQLMSRIKDAQKEFYFDQNSKAQYSDKYYAPTIRLQTADVQRERLDMKYKLSSGIYNELLKNLEEVRLNLSKETPVFQVLDPPIVPSSRTEPNRLIIVIVFFIVGLFFNIALILVIPTNFKKIIVNEKRV